MALEHVALGRNQLGFKWCNGAGPLRQCDAQRTRPVGISGCGNCRYVPQRCQRLGRNHAINGGDRGAGIDQRLRQLADLGRHDNRRTTRAQRLRRLRDRNLGARAEAQYGPLRVQAEPVAFTGRPGQGLRCHVEGGGFSEGLADNAAASGERLA